MRIAFISGMSHAPWGGSEILWSETAKRLLAGGHAVFASVARWPETPDSIKALRSCGVEIDERQWFAESRLSRRILSKFTRRVLTHPGWEPSWQRVVDFRPDLVCVSHGSALCGVDWMLRCRTANIPYVSVAQANCEYWWPDDERVKVSTTAYVGAIKAYFVSSANLSLFERQLGSRFTNGEVVCNPFNVSWKAQPAWPPDDGLFHLACVARLEPAAKGQDVLFQVFTQPKWRERPVKLSLYGKGPCEVGLQRLLKLDDLASRVSIKGHVSDVEGIWRTHHALVLPSRFEGLPLSLVEAMLCGRPAIVTDVGGNRELLEENVTGFVAAATTVRHLDEAMERAWRRRGDWQAMGEAAAASIRCQVPEDPAQVFADKLINLIR